MPPNICTPYRSAVDEQLSRIVALSALGSSVGRKYVESAHDSSLSVDFCVFICVADIGDLVE